MSVNLNLVSMVVSALMESTDILVNVCQDIQEIDVK